MDGLDALAAHLSSCGGAPFGLVSRQTLPTAEFLHDAFGARLKCLFSPEHGWFGFAAAGEKTSGETHPFWRIPVHSLYGETRRPTPEMLAGLERLVVDLPDIAVRCYTYLATLRLTLLAAADAGLPVTVLDRPVPLGGVEDGPRREDEFSSFVAPLDVPLCHGMTPGECAEHIRRAECPGLDLTVVKMDGWSHADAAPWPDFTPPSPAIRSWDCAAMYPATVFTEAYPAVDCDRHGPLAFRVIGAPWLDAARLRAETDFAAHGVRARSIRYVPQGGEYAGKPIDGLLLSVASPSAYRPVRAGTAALAATMRLWPDETARGARPEWMDKLMGTRSVRAAVESGDVSGLFAGWDAALASWRAGRVYLYRA